MDMNCKSSVGVETLLLPIQFHDNYGCNFAQFAICCDLELFSFGATFSQVEYHASIHISCTYFEKSALSYFEEEILVLRFSKMRSVIHQH